MAYVTINITDETEYRAADSIIMAIIERYCFACSAGRLPRRFRRWSNIRVEMRMVRIILLPRETAK